MRPLLLISFLWAVCLPAAEPLPGHSVHGEAFNEGPRQAAVLLPGMGRIDFPVTTVKAEAQAFFNQGVAQLHGFWYFEAERSFRQAASLDPSCAMAFWGMAMANVNQEKRAKGLLSKAVALRDSVSPREKLWIAAWENFHREDSRDKKSRALDLIRDLENIVQEYPGDVEAKAFLAWKIWHVRAEAPISSRQAVDALLDQVFAARRDHPAHHYRIHLWDDAKPIRAVESAAACGPTAPGIAHLWHMPGHTYAKLRRFDDAAWQQEASARVDHAHLAKTYLLPDQIHNYAHNQEWLVRTWNELGRAREAMALAANLIAIPRHPDFNTLDKSGSSAVFGRTRLLETLEKWELWEDLAAAADSIWIGPGPVAGPEVVRLRALGVAAFAQGEPSRLTGALGSLGEIRQREIRRREAETKKAGTAAAKKEAEKPGPADAAIAELRVLEAVLVNPAAAGGLLDGVGDKMPAVDRARCWVRLGQPAKAVALIPKFPRDLVGLAAKTEILLAGDRLPEVAEALREARGAAFALDPGLPVTRRMEAWNRKIFPGSDWRPAAPVRVDVGPRPELETLGGKLWMPPPAPEWRATGLDGATVSGKDLKGRPRVLLLVLGADCQHCVEQMQAFAKASAGFGAAGISLHVIGIEPPERGAKMREVVAGPGGPGMEILCDPGLEVFRAFRAYDDFEGDPLHGTVLVDGAGRIRWIDVGWKPFLDTAFLLEEAKRLLALPGEWSGR